MSSSYLRTYIVVFSIIGYCIIWKGKIDVSGRVEVYKHIRSISLFIYNNFGYFVRCMLSHSEFREELVNAFVCNVVDDDLSNNINPSSVDVVTLVRVGNHLIQWFSFLLLVITHFL